MSRSAATEWIVEGATRLLVPAGTQAAVEAGGKQGSLRGPGKVTGGAFYNPAMRFARELSLLFIQQRMQEKAGRHTGEGNVSYRLLDGLAATGARVVRIAKEAQVPEGVSLQAIACDRDPRVVSLLVQNIRENRVASRVAALRGDFHRVAPESHYDHVDIDPFGSPAPFLDTAVRQLARGSTLALTATDTAALTGGSPAACLRRYQAKPWRGPGMHEAALRILAGTAIRAAARHEIALRPVLAHATDHYVRVYLEGRRGARRADAALKGMGYMVEAADGTVHPANNMDQVESDARRWAGPLWTGALQDPRLVESLKIHLETHSGLDAGPLARFLGLAGDEDGAPPLYYEVGEIARAAGKGPLSRETLFAGIRDAGYRVCQTHASHTGVKTDMPWPRLVALVAGHDTT